MPLLKELLRERHTCAALILREQMIAMQRQFNELLRLLGQELKR
jgi:hypothetical protein